jgi:L-arabinose isomerase
VDALQDLEVWFLTGSQHLYGPEALGRVAEHSAALAKALGESPELPLRVRALPVQSDQDSIRKVMLAANADDACAGVIAWMHTFSPAKMWIGGLNALAKPLLHLHTQVYRDLPWDSIDMDFMNLHQSAHGDREFGFLASRLGTPRVTVAGHWGEPELHTRIGTWARAAAGVHEASRLRLARFGDNMREVAVTEGDKVEAQSRFGFSVNTYGVNELADIVGQIGDDETDKLAAVYDDTYRMAPQLQPGGERRESLRDAARIELALRAFLVDGGFGAFTDTFEDLGALKQLPGIAVQRLMADGYGFGGEGDWKTSALVRIMKVMAEGLPGATSFMEDYTYHLDPAGPLVLGAHMLEVCPTLTSGTPSCEIHPLGIGGRADPVRLVFNADPGKGFVAGLMDLGDRFRIVANVIEVVDPPHDLPKLPVARALWRPEPDLSTAAECWLTAGGPHHTSLTTALSVTHLEHFADLIGVELALVDAESTPRKTKQELRWNSAAFRLGVD